MRSLIGQGTATPSPVKTERAPNIAIVVVRLLPCHRPGNLKCFADVSIGKWIIVRGFRVVQEPGRAPWCGLPCNTVLEHDPVTGEMVRRWHPLILIPDHWRQAAAYAVLEAWQAYQESAQDSDPHRGSHS